MKVTAAAPEERIASIDAIRGIALFGVLMVNLLSGFRASIFEQFIPGASNDPVQRIVMAALESKAFSLFSLLFGIGLAMQLERLAATGRPFYWLARRLAVLLIFGLIHLLLVWNGDILTEYALAGAVVLPLLRLRQAGLLLAILIFFLLYLMSSAVVYSLPWLNEDLPAHVAVANQVYSSGTLPQIWRFSVEELRFIAPLHAWVFPRTVALFLLGAFLWRAGVLRRPRDFTDELTLVALVGIVAGAAVTVAGVGGWVAVLAPVVLALGYAAGLLALAQLPTGARLLAPFAWIGRMAFTNYMLQSIVFGFIFFGYGLGQFGRMSTTTALVLGVVVYAAQMLLSKWWLERHRFGPIEWLWRTLMYGVPPVRKGTL